MRKMHEYRNKLVEIELERRRRVDEAMRLFFPDLVDVELQIEEAVADVERTATEINQQHAKDRNRRRENPLKAKLKELRTHLKELHAKRKDMRASCFKQKGWVERQERIDQEDADRRKAARKHSGLYWGNYLVVEQALSGIRSGRPPKFKPWGLAVRKMKIAVQIQKGMTWEEALEGDDKRFRLERIPVGPQRSGSNPYNAHGRYHWAYLRIGSNGRRPIWAKINVEIDRPIPKGSIIKWVYLQRIRVGTTYKWMLQLVISSKDGFPRPVIDPTKATQASLVQLKQKHGRGPVASCGVVGIDLGWRIIDGSMRVAYWMGHDGFGGDLCIPKEIIDRWHKAWSLRSIRDRNFNEQVTALSEWKSAHRESVPEWFLERTSHMHNWRACARMAALVLHWRDNRFDGDENIFALMEAWRKQDKHLLEWEAHQTRNAFKWRDNYYRHFANGLAERFRTVKLEDIDIRKLGKRAEPDEDEKLTDMSRRYKQIAAIGRLREILIERFAEHQWVDPRLTTKRCAACKQVCEFDAEKHLTHTCEHCGLTWDQDCNAAINLI